MALNEKQSELICLSLMKKLVTRCRSAIPSSSPAQLVRRCPTLLLVAQCLTLPLLALGVLAAAHEQRQNVSPLQVRPESDRTNFTCFLTPCRCFPFSGDRRQACCSLFEGCTSPLRRLDRDHGCWPGRGR